MAQAVEHLLDECNATFSLSAQQHIRHMRKPKGPFRAVLLPSGRPWLGQPAECVPEQMHSAALDRWIVVNPDGCAESSLVYTGSDEQGNVFTHFLQGGDIVSLDEATLMVQQITQKNVIATIGPVSSPSHRIATVPLARVIEMF